MNNTLSSQTLEKITFDSSDGSLSHRKRIRLYYDLGKYEEALKLLEEAKRIFPENIGFVLDQANLYANLNRFDEALKVLNNSLSANDR